MRAPALALLLGLCGPLCLVAPGCLGPSASVGPSQLVAEVAELRTRHATLDTLWYQGRLNGFDHFLYEYGMYGKRSFRVPAGEAPLARSFAYSSANFDWVRVDTQALTEGRFVVHEWRGQQR